ncbi:MAG: hypothetical protein JO044_18810 [Mycobacteriaceae bacterium]|nr:hypothetical protein [Mycobacteriaceae bacterium]MBV9641879.1 hypothetical protein [Mycobacteriaceae bacterium]
MNDMDTGAPARTGRLVMPRSRGAASGFLLILLGIWGGLIPFVGPYFDFAYTPDREWTWTAARGWLEVLPAAATVVGGLLLLASGNRATAMLGGWLAVLGGAWFVVGPQVAGPVGIGDPGTPVASTDWKRAVLEIAYFSGLGVVIVFLGAIALGRLSVRSLRDLRYAQRPVAGTAVASERAAEPAPATTDAAAANEPATETDTPRGEAPDEPQPRRGGLFGRRRQSTQTTPAGR